MPNTRGLEALVAIGQEGSFRAAARRLGIAQSTLSMQIKSSRGTLEVALFDRSVRPPAMTPATVAMLSPAGEVLAGLDRIHMLARERSGLMGMLRLGVVPTATPALAPEAITHTVRRPPGVELSMEVGLSRALERKVRDRELDAALLTASSSDGGAELSVEPVLHERLALVSPRAQPARRIEELIHRPFIRFQRDVGVGAVIEQVLVEHGLAPAEYMELDSVEAILAMVERGLGVAIVPETSVRMLDRAAITALALDDPAASRTLTFESRVDNPRRPLLQILLGELRRAASRLR